MTVAKKFQRYIGFEKASLVNNLVVTVALYLSPT